MQQRGCFTKVCTTQVPANTRVDGKLGWQLGSDPEIQVPNLVSNHLTTGLLSYIHATGRYASGINLFEKLRSRDPEISSLLARVLIQGDEEVKAINLLKESIEELPMDYSLLDCQAAFLQQKNNLEWALPLAQRAVVAAPSEFGTWARLAEIYVGLEKWDLALLTLNSCPMFTYQDKDAPRMPEPARVNLPLLSDTNYNEIDESVNGYDIEAVHPNLRKLTAGNYKGTFLKAYSLLTGITAKIGWDQLLRIRSQVFVMEEEYRSEKSQPGTGRTTGRFTHTGRTPSTTALRAPSPQVNGMPSPSSEQNDGKEEKAEDDEEDGEDGENAREAKPGVEDATEAPSEGTVAADRLAQPKHTVASVEVKSGGEEVNLPSRKPTISKANHPSRTQATQITPTSNTNASASAGSTTSSWCCTRTYASTPSGARTWPAPKPPPSPPARQTRTTPAQPTTRAPRSGRSWATWRSGCTMRPRRSKRTRAA